MLASQLNDQVGDGLVENKAVIRMNRYTCNVIQEKR